MVTVFSHLSIQATAWPGPVLPVISYYRAKAMGVVVALVGWSGILDWLFQESSMTLAHCWIPVHSPGLDYVGR
jgi:hypothetical protein